MEKIYPFITSLDEPGRCAKGPLKPMGVTVHFTGSESMESTVAHLRANGLAYHLIIDRDGKVTQMEYLNAAVYHAGKARWAGRSPNREHIAVSILSWGMLSIDQKTWTGKRLNQDEIAERPGNNSKVVYSWHKATDAQEKTLLDVLTWLCVVFGIRPLEICGHDECALPLGRKEDPGGVLSVSMQELRSMIIRRLVSQNNEPTV